MNNQNIGIYIGAFDPIHEGHLRFARTALEENNIDKLYFLVEPQPKNVQGVKALNHRINMVILDVEDNKAFGTIAIKSKVGIEDYLPILQKRFAGKQLFLIMPEKDVSKLIKWSYLINLDHSITQLAIGVDPNSSTDVLHKLELLSLTSGIKFNYRIFGCGEEEYKTQEIRKKLKKGEKPPGVSEAVYDYISQEKLYATSGCVA